MFCGAGGGLLSLERNVNGTIGETLALEILLVPIGIGGVEDCSPVALVGKLAKLHMKVPTVYWIYFLSKTSCTSFFWQKKRFFKYLLVGCIGRKFSRCLFRYQRIIGTVGNGMRSLRDNCVVLCVPRQKIGHADMMSNLQIRNDGNDLLAFVSATFELSVVDITFSHN